MRLLKVRLQRGLIGGSKHIAFYVGVCLPIGEKAYSQHYNKIQTQRDYRASSHINSLWFLFHANTYDLESLRQSATLLVFYTARGK